jgi:hypothetical protein
VTNDELALRSSIGLFLFVPPGVNEQLIEASGFRLLKHEDVSANAALVSGRWHESRQRHKDALIRSKEKNALKVFNNFLRPCTALPVKDGYRDLYTWSKNRLAKTFFRGQICGSTSALLLQENLHVLKVKSDRVGLEKIVTDHAREVEAEHVFPRERSIIQTRDVFFLYVSE